MDDLGRRLQVAAEQRLMAIADAEDALEENPDAEVDYPACAPFCGCETCVVREVLDASWDVLIDALCDAGFAEAAAWLAGQPSVRVSPAE